MGLFTRQFLQGLFITLAIGTALIGLSACDKKTNTGDVTEQATTAAQVITIGEPRIRATAPGQKVSGAFLTLTNSSNTPFALTSASFDAAGVVEIHETSMQDKMMRMLQVQQIDIPANGSVELKPGSYHIMLMGLTKALQAGSTEALTLTFSDNSQVTVEATVSDLSK